jgi:hypothetical protein
MEYENAVIESTTLGIQHGVLTCWLHLAGDGWGCGFGGYALDEWDPETRTRHGDQRTAQFINRILSVVGVDAWEKLPGKVIRVNRARVGDGITIIGNVVKDEWLDAPAFWGK